MLTRKTYSSDELPACFSLIKKEVKINNFDYGQELVKYFKNTKLRIKSYYDNYLILKLPCNIIEVHPNNTIKTEIVFKNLVNLISLNLVSNKIITDTTLISFLKLTSLNLCSKYNNNRYRIKWTDKSYKFKSQRK